MAESAPIYLRDSHQVPVNQILFDLGIQIGATMIERGPEAQTPEGTCWVLWAQEAERAGIIDQLREVQLNPILTEV